MLENKEQCSRDLNPKASLDSVIRSNRGTGRIEHSSCKSQHTVFEVEQEYGAIPRYSKHLIKIPDCVCDQNAYLALVPW